MKAYPYCGEDVIRIIGMFIPMLELIGRNFDILVDKAKYYIDLSISLLQFKYNRLQRDWKNNMPFME